MEFKTTLKAEASSKQITHQQGAFFVGSCFSDHIGQRLLANKFSVAINPWGTMFNPISLEKNIKAALDDAHVDEALICKKNGLFFHHLYHSDLHACNKLDLSKKIATANKSAKNTLSSASFVFITLGTAWTFKHLQSKEIVANCHQQKASAFEKILLPIIEIEQSLNKSIEAIREVNKDAEIIFTVSPVRHIKNGLSENNRSKAHLLSAVHQICDEHINCQYYPSYELIMDDLRDYRFYREDLIHPNEMAIEYVWEHFKAIFFDNKTRKLCKEISKIKSAAQHRLLNPASIESQDFLKIQLSKIAKLNQQAPYLDFDSEEAYFKNLLNA